MPDESFLEREDLCAEVALFSTEETKGGLRSEDLLLSENETTFFNGEQGFSTTPRAAAAMADLKESVSMLALCKEKLAVSDDDSAQDCRTWFSDSEMAKASSSLLRSTGGSIKLGEESFKAPVLESSKNWPLFLAVLLRCSAVGAWTLDAPNSKAVGAWTLDVPKSKASSLVHWDEGEESRAPLFASNEAVVRDRRKSTVERAEDAAGFCKTTRAFFARGSDFELCVLSCRLFRLVVRATSGICCSSVSLSVSWLLEERSEFEDPSSLDSCSEPGENSTSLEASPGFGPDIRHLNGGKH
jgi:hypothetical protein